MRAALLGALLLTCGRGVEQRTDVVMGGWEIQVGDQSGVMLLLSQGPGTCGVFRLGSSSGWVYGLEAEVEEAGVRATFNLGGFEVHALREVTGRFGGVAWRDDYQHEDFAAHRKGGGGPGRVSNP
jgi:hypothetical protein